MDQSCWVQFLRHKLANSDNDDRTILPKDAPAKLLGMQPNTLVVPYDQSASPDVFLLLPDNLVAFQCKLSNDPLAWADLKSEIANAEPFATEEKPLSFVIAAFALDDKLLAYLNEAEVCCGTSFCVGDWL